MAEAPVDPTLERYRKAWAKYDRTDRRRVMRAVNRMQPLDEPAEAALGILYARRQRRMWTRWAWLYPLIPAAMAWGRGWEAVMVNLLVGALFIALFAGAFTWRAKRSERIQQEVIDASQQRKRSGSPKTRAAARGTGGSASRKPKRRKRG